MPDHGREQDDTYHITDDTSEYGGAAGINHKASGDLRFFISQPLQYTDLPALFFYHTAHCRDTHERCHQDKEQGKYVGNLPHDLRIALKA